MRAVEASLFVWLGLVLEVLAGDVYRSPPLSERAHTASCQGSSNKMQTPAAGYARRVAACCCLSPKAIHECIEASGTAKLETLPHQVDLGMLMFRNAPIK